MRTIPLYGKYAEGRVAVVDDEDFDLVSQYRWVLWQRTRPRSIQGPYVVAYVQDGEGRLSSIKMHKLITGWPMTDHVDRDGLNNQRSNLRECNLSSNQQNRGPVAGHSSRFKGVLWDRGRFKARISVGGHSRYLGRFLDEADAARAYDAAARELFGEFAYLNFPD